MKTHDRRLADHALQTVTSLSGLTNTFALGASSLTEAGAVTSCSTFLGILLRDLFKEAPQRTPRARNWIEHLEPVEWKDVVPGHIGVIQYVEDREKMSGHCFVVVHKGQNFAGEYGLEVVDSCRTSHGSDDTRFLNGQGIGGVGRGIMTVRAGELAKEVESYKWSPSISSETMLQGKGQRLVFGRVPRSWTLKEKTHG